MVNGGKVLFVVSSEGLGRVIMNGPVIAGNGIKKVNTTVVLV